MDAVEILSVITTDAAQRLTLTEMDDAIAEAIQALESMPEYERLKERDRAKPAENKILLEGGRLYIGDCPSCGLGITQANFCGNCGQRIDWSEE